MCESAGLRDNRDEVTHALPPLAFSAQAQRILGKLLSGAVFGGTPSEEKKKQHGCRHKEVRRGKLCMSAKREVGRERRVARVAPGGAGEGGEVKGC